MVHPAVEQAYKNVGLDYQPDTNDLIEMKFREATKDQRGNSIPTEKRINSMYRVKVGEKEYLIYRITEYARDYLGNKHSWNHPEGRYKYPEFSTRFDAATGRPKATGVADNELRYEYPYTGPESVDAILRKGTVPYQTQFYVETGYATYACTLQEFRTRTMYELEQKGMTGKFPKPEEVERERLRQAQDLLQNSAEQVSKTVNSTYSVSPPSAPAAVPTPTPVTDPREGVQLGIPADLLERYPELIKTVEQPRTASSVAVKEEVKTQVTKVEAAKEEEEEDDDNQAEAQRIQRAKQDLERRRRISTRKKL